MDIHLWLGDDVELNSTFYDMRVAKEWMELGHLRLELLDAARLGVEHGTKVGNAISELVALLVALTYELQGGGVSRFKLCARVAFGESAGVDEFIGKRVSRLLELFDLILSDL